MTIAKLEADKAGFRCRSCGITVFGWREPLLCTSCSEAKRPRYVPGKVGVDSACADLAELLMSEVKGATDADVTELAEAVQLAFEDQVAEIEVRLVVEAAAKP